MLTHSPRHPPRYPAARPCGFAALLDLPGILANSSRCSSDTASIFFPAALRYSPAQMGTSRPCNHRFWCPNFDQTTTTESHADALQFTPPSKLPSNAGVERLSRGLFERSEFRRRAQHRVTQGSRRPAWSGWISFGYFSLAIQRKVTRRKRRKTRLVTTKITSHCSAQ